MSVAHDHAAVKTVVTRFASRYDLDFCGEEIFLLYTIFFFQDFHDICFDLFFGSLLVILALCLQRNTSDQRSRFSPSITFAAFFSIC